jgi:hypothetical protein
MALARSLVLGSGSREKAVVSAALSGARRRLCRRCWAARGDGVGVVLGDEEDGDGASRQREGDKGSRGDFSLWWCLIRPKRIYFLEHFCYCFSSNLCVLNTTNTD